MIRWDTCRGDFAPDGALRDIYVHGTSLDDWQSVLNSLHRYRLEYLVDDLPQAIPATVDEAFKLHDTASLTLRIDAGGITIISHFFTRDEIEFDFDPREVQSQASLDELLSFLQLVGDTLCKLVVVSYENDGQRPFMTYEPREKTFQYREFAT